MIHLATATKTARQVSGDVPDETFVAALDFEFRNAPTIARHMLMAGTPATLMMIRQRMAEFVTESPYIEAGDDAWRIVATSPTIPPQPANDDHKIELPTAVGQPVLIDGCGLEMLRGLPDASIDLALLDLPYGITRTSFDPVINVDAHMEELRRVVTPTGAIVCFATQPFTTKLINAAPDLFKQALVWEKPGVTGFAQARARHLKCHEDILIFSKGTIIGKRSKRQMTYNPQGAVEVARVLPKGGNTKYMGNTQVDQGGKKYVGLANCPRSVLRFAKDSKGHSFAKPIALLDYLIRTFSNDNEVVLDHTMGSGSTGVAAHRAGRRFIGAENGFLEDGRSIFKIAEGRIGAELTGQDNLAPAPSDDDLPPTPPKPRGGKQTKKRREWSPEQRAKYAATVAAKKAAPLAKPLSRR
ncbi:site-specific DNA-methyltransferase [Novosphingobium sp. 9U]|uniref:DNA-methyltransferase n=1 Tax=Novosphingobium sp. 9U TaxID=2653158 RepID=UPI0012EF423F|nr:site-specific DNA-methyltransferase [Novosphingobium sp. 9U]VWX51813.1 Gp10 [Novosphingobium sp. 9U]